MIQDNSNFTPSYNGAPGSPMDAQLPSNLPASLAADASAQVAQTPLAQTDAALRHLGVAVSLHLKNDRQGALKALEDAEKSGGDAGEICAARGHIQFELGQFDQAAISYGQLRKLRPTQPEVQLVLGLCLHNLERYAEALECFRGALMTNPRNADAHLAAGTCLLRLNKPADALESFQAALALAPDSQSALFGEAVALQMSWEFDEAAVRYERLLAVTPQAEDPIANLIGIGLQRKDYAMVRRYSERLLTLRPDAPAALEGLAASAFAEEDYASAAAHSRRLTAIAPELHDTWYNLGVACQKLGQNQDAVKAYLRAIELRPNGLLAHINLGVTYEQNGELAQAAAAFDRAIQLSPDRDDLRLHVAWLTEQQQLPAEAEKLYAKIVELKPDSETAWFRLGYLRLERGDAKAGAEAFRACLNKKADWPEAEVNLSIALSQLGQTTESEATLENLLARHPDHREALKGLAEMALRREDPTKALNHYRRLIDLGESNSDILFNCGVLSQQLAQNADAVRFYRAALAKEPRFPEALLNLGHALEQIGDEAGARECWIQALELKPELAYGYFSPRVGSASWQGSSRSETAAS